MSAIPGAVADPTDNGTLRPNIEPEPAAGNHFRPLFCPEFPPQDSSTRYWKTVLRQCM
jgi:hypothetical protein